MLNLSARWPSMQAAEGLVLVDEIEVHLHPSWRMQIVALLRAVFPRVRFLVTTHDPLCLQQTEAGEVVVLRWDPDDVVRAGIVNVPKGLRADQLLTGPWFGLASTLDRETFDLVAEHSTLLVQAGGGQRAAELETELRSRLGQFAETSTERMAQQVGAEVTAERGEPAAASTDARESLRSAVLAEVRRRKEAEDAPPGTPRHSP